MVKSLELESPDSCWNKAQQDEYVFVLLGRDVAAASTIDFWCDERIRLGKNVESDDKIENARMLASNIRAKNG